MTRILLARHGLADYETDLITDDGGSLSVEGRAQARALGAVAQEAGVTAVWCSPRSRAVQTAEIAAAIAGVTHVTVREGLREYGVGAAAGRPDGEEAALLLPAFEAWGAGDDTATIPGGERVAGLAERMTVVLEEVAAASGPDGLDGPALVVTHGGVTMVTVPTLTGLPRETARDFVLPGGGHLVLEREPTGWVVK